MAKLTVGERIDEAKKAGVLYFEIRGGGRRCTIAEYYSIRIDVFSQYGPVFKEVEHGTC